MTNEDLVEQFENLYRPFVEALADTTKITGIEKELEQWGRFFQTIATVVLVIRIIFLAKTAILVNMENADNSDVKKQLIIYISAVILLNVAPEILAFIVRLMKG